MRSVTDSPLITSFAEHFFWGTQVSAKEELAEALAIEKLSTGEVFVIEKLSIFAPFSNIVELLLSVFYLCR